MASFGHQPISSCALIISFAAQGFIINVLLPAIPCGISFFITQGASCTPSPKFFNVSWKSSAFGVAFAGSFNPKQPPSKSKGVNFLVKYASCSQTIIGSFNSTHFFH